MEIRIFGTEEIFEIKESQIKSYETSSGDTYDQAYQLEDGRWIAFDEAVNSWVMLG